ncbi:MAG TPA: hypothetical protein EYN91_23635 [Candidatus Melainabacteria bacterium]|nr:hypothetical protein [Candidatus Melainabacteria bacterium]HIN66837.1 hypothetical protein [Candidatus Obscuribacterales bacterium]
MRKRPNNSSAKFSLALATVMSLSLASAGIAEESPFFDEEPPSAKPKVQAEPTRTIRMEIQDNEELPQKKPGKLSLFKRAPEDKRQIAAKESDSVKDVPDENPKNGGVLSAPKRAAGVMCGLMVGVPYRAAKTMAHETKRMNSQVTNDLTWDGRRPDLTARMFGAALSVPYGITTGMITGVVKGTERAVHTGGRKPLSKESMSITDPEFK